MLVHSFLSSEKVLISKLHHPSTTTMVSSSHTEEHGQHLAKIQIRNLISTIISRLSGLSKFRALSDTGNDDDGNSINIISLTRDNKGATMKGNMELKGTHRAQHEDETGFCPYTNGNYEAVNNSIVSGGKCEAKDRGVHTVVSDYMEDDVEDQDENKHDNKEKNQTNKDHEREERKKE